MAGTLYVVATPIGNLGDLTERARKTLASVALIACEDTRVTGKLLRHLQSKTPMVSFHEHNEVERTGRLLARLEAGDDVALVSDAGTPGISDPGFRLIRAARRAGIAVRVVPGPSALTAALVASGLPPAPFTFVGFLPPRGAARGRALSSLIEIDHTLVLFEAPTRFARLLADLARALGPRPAVLLREMTKLHEEHRSGTLPELADWARNRPFRGELTLVIGPESNVSKAFSQPLSTLASSFAALRAKGLSSREAAKALARTHGISAREIYNAFAASTKT